jgi:hypothetical protein
VLLVVTTQGFATNSLPNASPARAAISPIAITASDGTME